MLIWTKSCLWIQILLHPYPAWLITRFLPSSLFRTTLLIHYIGVKTMPCSFHHQTGKKVLGYTSQLSVLRETVFWIQRPLKRNEQGYCQQQEKLLFFITIWSIWTETTSPCPKLQISMFYYKTNNLHLTFATLHWRSLWNCWLIYCATAINNLALTLALVSVHCTLTLSI